MSKTQQALEHHQTGDDADIAHIVDCIIVDAISLGSSDIHIEPWDETLVIRFRLNGVLKEFEHIPLELAEKISARLKVMANLVNYETEKPQEGHARASAGGGVELRLSFFPVVRGGDGNSFLKVRRLSSEFLTPKAVVSILISSGLTQPRPARLRICWDDRPVYYYSPAQRDPEKRRRFMPLSATSSNNSVRVSVSARSRTR